MTVPYAAADGLVVPGVGAYAACMAGIEALGAGPVIAERVAAGRPIMSEEHVEARFQIDPSLLADQLARLEIVTLYTQEQTFGLPTLHEDDALPAMLVRNFIGCGSNTLLRRSGAVKDAQALELVSLSESSAVRMGERMSGRSRAKSWEGARDAPLADVARRCSE